MYEYSQLSNTSKVEVPYAGQWGSCNEKVRSSERSKPWAQFETGGRRWGLVFRVWGLKLRSASSAAAQEGHSAAKLITDAL